VSWPSSMVLAPHNDSIARFGSFRSSAMAARILGSQYLWTSVSNGNALSSSAANFCAGANFPARAKTMAATACTSRLGASFNAASASRYRNREGVDLAGNLRGNENGGTLRRLSGCGFGLVAPAVGPFSEGPTFVIHFDCSNVTKCEWDFRVSANCDDAPFACNHLFERSAVFEFYGNDLVAGSRFLFLL
jgi:hypothetical protein